MVSHTVFKSKSCNSNAKGHIIIHIRLLFATKLYKLAGIIGWPLWKVSYCVVPTYLCTLLYESGVRLRRIGEFSFHSCKRTLFFFSVASFLGTEILVNSFFERSVLTLGLFLNAAFLIREKKLRLSSCHSISLLVSVTALAIFPIVPLSFAKKLNPFFV